MKGDTTLPPRRALRTTDAARYLGVSASLLRKMRGRGPDDPLGPGPVFRRLSRSLIVYDVRALDEWFEQHRAASGMTESSSAQLRTASERTATTEESHRGARSVGRRHSAAGGR